MGGRELADKKQLCRCALVAVLRPQLRSEVQLRGLHLLPKAKEPEWLPRQSYYKVVVRNKWTR